MFARVIEMASRSSSDTPIVVYGAIAANFIIAVAKFVAAAFTGSSAMLSEGIHSVADTGNQGLILLGLNRSKKPADEMHPFGHGKELYFWSLIVAIILFGIGGGLSIYEGVIHVQHPAELGDPLWNYAVLGIAFIAEGIAWSVALRELLHHQQPGQSFWQTFRSSKDPSVYTVLGEDTAALLGIIVAFAGVYLGHRLNLPVLDGVASLVIGTILIIVAVFLAYESKGLIVGESADMDVVQRIRQVATSDPAVAQVREVLTLHFGPRDILLNMNVEFRSTLPASELAMAVDRLETTIRQEEPDIKRIFIEAESFKTQSEDRRAIGSSTSS